MYLIKYTSIFLLIYLGWTTVLQITSIDNGWPQTSDLSSWNGDVAPLFTQAELVL